MRDGGYNFPELGVKIEKFIHLCIVWVLKNVQISVKLTIMNRTYTIPTKNSRSPKQLFSSCNGLSC